MAINVDKLDYLELFMNGMLQSIYVHLNMIAHWLMEMYP